MKEFVTAVEDLVSDDEYEEKVKALIEAGKTRDEAEAEVDRESGVVAFKIDDRVMKAFPPHEGQLMFMLAALGRGQRQENRFASIVNIMMESLRSDDQDYFESRLMSRDRKERLPIKQVEEIFEFLVGEWFAGGDGTDRPTPPSSDSV
jgi:hypothetical protein